MAEPRRVVAGAGVSRRAFLGVAGAGVLGALAGCGPAAPDALLFVDGPEEQRQAAETLGDGKTLRVGMEAAYPPYNWQETSASENTIRIENVQGAYADGYDVQVARRIAEAFGMEAVAVKMSFGGLVDALVNGQIDIICAGMSATPERAESIDFSDSYLDDDIALVVKKDGPYAGATSLADFSGTSVLGQKDTMYDDVIDQIPDVHHMTPATSVPTVVENIMNGTCDAITFSLMSLPYLLKNYPDLMQVPLEKGFEDSVMPDNAGVAKGQDAVLAKVNEAIGAISADERQQIWNDCMDRQPA